MLRQTAVTHPSPVEPAARSSLLLTLFTWTLIGQSAVLPAVAAQTSTSTGLSVAEMQADLEAFRQRFLEVDQSYSDEARAQAEAEFSALASRLAETTPAQFELTLAQIVALADNGHSSAFESRRSDRYNRVPIRFTPFGESFYVLRATQEHKDLLGARVVAIGGQPFDEILEASRTLSGGLPTWRDRGANYFIESPQQMHALGLVGDRDRLVYEFVSRTGDRIERLLEGQPPSEERLRGGAKRWLFPQPGPEEEDPEEGGSWTALLSTEEVPWSLRDYGQPFRSRDAPELDATVIELRRNDNPPEQRIGAALMEMKAAIEQGQRQHLIVDMRWNSGGNLNLTRGFMQSLPDLTSGRIFVLMSPWTFSAAISSIGYLEQVAPDRVTLVGEGPGDRLEFFSEGRIVTLPNSGAVILNATESHDYRTGCKDKSDCHRPVVMNPIAVPSLSPDIAAPWTFEAYAQGRDPGMEAVAAALGGSKR